MAIVGAAFVGFLVSHVRQGVVFSNQTLVAWVGVLAMAVVDFVDGSIKIRTLAIMAHGEGVARVGRDLTMPKVAVLPFGVRLPVERQRTRLALPEQRPYS